MDVRPAAAYLPHGHSRVHCYTAIEGVDVVGDVATVEGRTGRAGEAVHDARAVGHSHHPGPAEDNCLPVTGTPTSFFVVYAARARRQEVESVEVEI